MGNKIIIFFKQKFFCSPKTRRASVIILVVAFAAAGLFFLINFADVHLDKMKRNGPELTIGFITDVHAGGKESKEKGSGLIYPDHFKKNMDLILKDEEMKKANYIIALGDNIDGRSHCQTYADELKKMTKDFNIKWVKGNHDKEACFSLLAESHNYYFEKNDWRIIIFNNSYWYPVEERQHIRDKIGFIEPEELNWLKEAMKTDKKLLLAMHIPIWNDNGEEGFSLRNDYVDFKKMLENQGNVKYVLSGHYHNNYWEHEENGIKYYILPSLEQDGYEGYHMTLKLE